jgi:DNA-binding PadR family transcriptional regulator
VSFEIQELPDVIRIIVLLSLSKGTAMKKTSLKRRMDKICGERVCIGIDDIDKALREMASEGLILEKDEMVQLTEQGAKLSKEWESLLLKKEPIIEVVAGLVDGSVTSLVVVLSEFIAGLSVTIATFAAFLTLAAVAITNFSSFLLGGITEDLADIMTLQSLMGYSLSDIPDRKERDKSLLLLKQLFTLLHKEINKSNIYAAMICGTTTFLAGSIPIIAYLALARPFNIILSLSIVGAIAGIFLVRYRSKRTRVHWKITLFETLAIVAIAVLVSLLLGGTL